MQLRDKDVVVTGAASGIGRALVQRFGAESPRALVGDHFETWWAHPPNVAR